MQDQSGRTLSHYRLIEKIGEGGMGVVYRAEDKNLRRQIALKLLTGDPRQDPGLRSRLLNEARAAARINHPNICTVHEVHESVDDARRALERCGGSGPGSDTS